MIGQSHVTRASDRSRTSAQDLLSSLVAHLTDPSSAIDASAPGLPSVVYADLAEALAEIATTGKPRASVRVRLGEEPWEIGIELSGSVAFVSVFAGGALPHVLVHDRRVDLALLRTRLDEALAGVERTKGAELGRVEGRATSARHLLGTLTVVSTQPVDSETLVVEPVGELSFGLSAELSLRPPPPLSVSPSGTVLRADLLALLVRGKFRVSALEHARELPDVHVFLVAEQLARLVLEALEAQAVGRPVWRKVQVGGAVCGIRLVHPRTADGEPSEAASVTLGLLPKSPGGRADSWTFPLVDLGSFAEGVVAFGRALARSLVRRDRSQTHNLRLVEFRAKLREISEVTRELSRDDAKVNHSPESYRAYAAQTSREREAGPSPARLRFVPRWQAAVPSIDLRATYLSGDGIIVGAAREICCITRRTGELAWRQPVQKAVSVMTPCGLARFDAEGTLRLHSLDSGEVRWTLKMSPRVGAPVTGAVVSAPSLPRMLLLSEGKRHIAGVDLESGQIAWRYAARRAGTFRLRRAGKLGIVSSGEQALTALDVTTGEIVWRYCDRLRFASLVSVDQDALFAVAGDGAFVGRGGTRLHHLDPWSGAERWSVELSAHVKPVGAPLIGSTTVVLATHGHRGTGLIGFDRRTGDKLFEREACVGAAASLVVDDTVLLNSEAGELVAVDAANGEVRYRHVFADGYEGDRPRRLEPVLRSGALFVPQTSVHVVRPHDGAVLGTVATDLIPDLVRVDERCDVYVAEESGHLTAFGAAAKLTLVK